MNFGVFSSEMNDLGTRSEEWPTALGLPDPFSVSALILNLQVHFLGVPKCLGKPSPEQPYQERMLGVSDVTHPPRRNVSNKITGVLYLRNVISVSVSLHICAICMQLFVIHIHTEWSISQPLGRRHLSITCRKMDRIGDLLE